MGLFQKKIKYKLVFVRKEYATMNVVCVKTLKKPLSIVKLSEKKSFQVNYEIPCYVSRLNRIYFIDYENGSQIKFDIIERPLTPENLDTIISNRVLEQIAKGVLSNKKQALIFAILGAIFGGLLAYTITSNIMNGKLQEAYDSCRTVVVPFS